MLPRRSSRSRSPRSGARASRVMHARWEVNNASHLALRMGPDRLRSPAGTRRTFGLDEIKARNWIPAPAFWGAPSALWSRRPHALRDATVDRLERDRASRWSRSTQVATGQIRFGQRSRCFRQVNHGRGVRGPGVTWRLDTSPGPCEDLDVAATPFGRGTKRSTAARDILVTYGHEAEAKAALSHAHVSRVGRLLREMIGWPFASKRTKSLQDLRETRPVGPSHLRAHPRDDST